MPRGRVAAVAAAALAAGAGAGTLVVHVGPHKVATTSTQHFLATDAAWLAARYGVASPANASAKEAAHVANTYLRRDGYAHYNLKFANETTAASLITALGKLLRRGRTCVISAEDLDQLSAQGWRRLVADVDAAASTKVAWRAVVTHRDAASRLVSAWHSANDLQALPPDRCAESFGVFAADELAGDAARVFRGDVALLRTLYGVFGRSNVRAASFERLAEANSSVAAFLVCNATLELRGGEWAACDREVAARSSSVFNPSQTTFATDAMRLACLAASLAGCRNATRISRAPLVRDRLRDLAGTLPTHCDGTTGACRSPLCSLAADAARAWFALSGALPPERPPGARSCLVDEGRLTEEHWRAIRAAFAFKCKAKYPGAFGGPKGRGKGGGRGRPG